MNYTVNDTLVYVLLLTRHIRSGDVPRAILAVLLELGIQPHSDGFSYLRKAIYEKYCNPDHRLSTVYQAVSQLNNASPDTILVEQAIRTAIDAAWKNRDDEIWSLFFQQDKYGRTKRPSNGEFIAQIACLMELWYGCSKEVMLCNKIM